MSKTGRSPGTQEILGLLAVKAEACRWPPLSLLGVPFALQVLVTAVPRGTSALWPCHLVAVT